jgi:hypothetical protein
LDGVNYQTSNKFTGLAAGTYTGYVKDAKCPAVPLPGITVNKTTALTVKASKTNATACNNDGTITLTKSGGTSPFTYSLDGVNYQTSNKFTGLAAGTYTGYVKDAKCPAVSLPGITITTTVCNSIAGSSSTTSGDAASIKVLKKTLFVFPNPANSILNTELKGYTGNVTMQLRNIEGKVLFEKKVQAISSITQQQLDVSKLPGGVYLLIAIDEYGNKQTEKIIVAH